ncbi:MAG: 2-dehydropantoate 2-reductase [Firmicutes bacterium]|nr:2-dehydropantoate 2-reductase [Bacillota bacterium]
MKVLVMGAGAIGGFFGGLLARASEEVFFVARGQHLEALRTQGLRVTSFRGDFRVKVKAGDAREAAAEAPFDLILFATKSYDTEPAARELLGTLGSRTAVLSLQNGVDNEGKLQAILGPQRVLGGVAYVEASLVEPGVIRHSAAGRIIFGELDGKTSPRVEAIMEAFRRAGIDSELSAQIMAAKWEKLVFNCALNAMTALTRTGVAAILATPEGQAGFRQAMEEVRQVALAAGIPLPSDVVERRMAFAASGDMHSSMERDLSLHRPLELEALNGVVVREGRRLGVPTPINEALYGLVKAASVR